MCLILTGCLEDRSAPQSASVSSMSSWFEGVTSVTNFGGFPISIKVSWNASTKAKGYHVYSFVKNPGTNSSGWHIIAEISDPSITSYIDRNSQVLTPGSTCTYMVKAVGDDNSEDANEVQKSTVAFEGISLVQILSQQSAQVTVNTAGSFSQLRVVAHPTRLPITDISQDVSKSFSSNEKVILLEGLRPGTSYSFIAQALVNDSGQVDGNQLSINGQTPSDSFGSGDATEGPDKYAFRNVRLIQAFGSAPNEINTTTLPTAPSTMTSIVNPHERMIKIIPNPFAGSRSGKFRVIRAAGVGLTSTTAPDVIDTTTKTVCSATTNTSCVVCGHSATANIDSGDCDLSINNVPPTFLDKALAAPPKKYFYTITYVNNSTTVLWPEELPVTNKNDFLLAAHVPDQYMVLVQRDSVNYEMCGLLGQASDPRKFNRCRYSGIGDRPYNTKGVSLGLPSGYYDFGYNLLVDRHALSCNWSRPLPATPPMNQPCGNANGCMSFAAQPSGSGFMPETVANTAPNTLPSFNFTPSTAYANAPTTLFNLQTSGNNCYVGYLSAAAIAAGGDPAAVAGAGTAQAVSWRPVGALADQGISLSSTAAPVTKAQIKTIISKAVSADPGPLGAHFSDRKRPVISGLSNTQAQSLCNSQANSAYGVKRLLRRREYVAATPLPSLPGEPGFTNSTNKNLITSGSVGQTLYNWQSSPTQLYGDGTNAGLGTNPGACAGPRVGFTFVSNPMYCLYPTCSLSKNTTVPRISDAYCSQNGGCTRSTNSVGNLPITAPTSDSDGAPINFPADFMSAYLDPRNETTQISVSGSGASGNLMMNRFFSGSLATNKCVSRFGMQDPFASVSLTAGAGFTTQYRSSLGIILSDQFKQTSTLNMTTNPPVFVPISNNLDFGVFYDYTYNNSSSTIEFSNANTGYSNTGFNGNDRRTCTSAVTGVSISWFTNNFFYLTGNLTAMADPTTCASDASGSTASLSIQPQKNQSSFGGYLPVLGLPLSIYAAALNTAQSVVDFASFLFGNQFSESPDKRQSYGRFFYDTATTGTVNMSTGIGGRWSYELSKSDTVNNGGTAWCAVEAE